MISRSDSYDLMTDWARNWMDKHGISVIHRVGYHNLARQVFKATYSYQGKILESKVSFFRFVWISRGCNAELANELAALVLKKPWEHDTVIAQPIG